MKICSFEFRENPEFFSTDTSCFHARAHAPKTIYKTIGYDNFQFQQSQRKILIGQLLKRQENTCHLIKNFLILKHTAGISETGRNMVRRQKKDCDKCLRCSAPDEHGCHIIQCTHNEAYNTFKMLFATLGIWLNRTTTPDMETAITDLVIAAQKDSGTVEGNYLTDIEEAMKSQIDIGLYPFLCGILSKKWYNLQILYYEDINSRKCAQKWTAMLSTKLIKIVHNMWIHRNDVLHQKDNIITDIDHERINKQIQIIYKGLLTNRLLLTHSEDKLFRAATADIIKKRILRRKKQWVKKARTIPLAISSRQNQCSTQLLYGAMRINHQHTNVNPQGHTTHHTHDSHCLNPKRRRMQRDTG